MTEAPAPQDFPRQYATGGVLPPGAVDNSIAALLTSGCSSGLTNADVSALGSTFLAQLNMPSVTSLEAATNEFIAAHIEYVTAQLSCLLWSDTSIVIHETCCARRVAVAAAWLGSELQRHASTAQFDANYDDDTIIAMLEGMQG